MKWLRDPIEADSPVMKCSLCEDCGWVCETHPGRPWEGDHACACGVPALHARGVTCLMRTGRRGCRIVSRQTLTKKAGVISARGLETTNSKNQSRYRGAADSSRSRTPAPRVKRTKAFRIIR
jgi:hypothetical protein